MFQLKHMITKVFSKLDFANLQTRWITFDLQISWTTSIIFLYKLRLVVQLPEECWITKDFYRS